MPCDVYRGSQHMDEPILVAFIGVRLAKNILLNLER